MSIVSSMFGNSYGLGVPVETFEQAWSWGPQAQLMWAGGQIYSGALDLTNTPTTNLRPGLVLGIRTSDGSYTNYNPTATDGSQIAVGVLPVGYTMVDFLTGVGQTKLSWILIGGKVQASKLINLDLQARASLAPRFIFDDNIATPNYRFPWSNFASKTAAYSVLSTDNFTIFDNTGAVGSVTFTLPAIANGYCFGFRVVANQNVIVASNEGGNMIALNNATASSVAFQTGSQLIGGAFMIYSNPAGTKWIVENISAGTNTITVA